MHITFADLSLRSQLTELWQLCFNEKPAAIELFFGRYFKPENCLVYLVDGQVAATVHMLPTHIAQGSDIVPGHYIYAAATRPDYRSQGLMAALLEEASLRGRERGDHYSLLLPSEQGLYSYYGRHGYVPFFKTMFTTLTREQLESIAGDHQPDNPVFSPAELHLARTGALRSIEGSVLWSKEALHYASSYNELYDGQLVCSGDNANPAYAICAAPEDELCRVLELVADKASIPGLAGSIVARCPAKKYEFRLPVARNPFTQEGEVTHFGMIKPLLGVMPSSKDAPYLGLTLD